MLILIFDFLKFFIFQVQKWLEAQMGVVPDRPVTPNTNATATSTSPGMGKSPGSKGVSNLTGKLISFYPAMFYLLDLSLGKCLKAQ